MSIGSNTTSGITFRLVQVDLNDFSTMAKAAKAVGSPLHVLINNAGMAFKGDAFSVDVAT